jgi:HlyD family secretion protein
VQQDQAQISVGQAAIKQSQATLAGDKINLAYATIVSPVDGVVVSRNVDVGQTVAASLSAPTLFLIAQDLTKVQIQTSVPEADIGKVHKDQHVHFTVDAHPDRGFDGVVSQVRLASTTVQNVVTYTVVVDAENPDGLLFPGMTADVTFEIARSDKEVLKVPATALRLSPPADLVEKAAKPGASEEAPKKERGSRGTRANGDAPKKSGAPHERKSAVYVVTADNRLRAIAVKVGISDGIATVVEPVEPGTLDEGTEIVTSIVRDTGPATTNPFAPPRMGGGRGR